ncbi:MOSC domain-containing protein YiiM [Trichophyton interdigitale]|uniref:MOSC domain-containing protein YiiM n=1 Tax=Trichophyton interdigitale TaxID=101480 RepID=A0A9P4YIT4_9EURO|nr:MOSC domain-containing protein YiiM [Trichophyton interdigitale]KAF3896053.1 MOSC domain-containing protein YiiM [Trichophyton interdigitale]KAG8211077.1 MOSC domain-containing protein YiiM [Trichophyton interdigitale]
MSVLSVSASGSHDFSKSTVPNITLVENVGVKGDAHSGAHVQHLSRLHINPPPQNLRQVHLMPYEVLKAVNVNPGQLGENITTEGIDLLALSKGTKLRFVDQQSPTTDCPVVTVTGLRNPCPQIDKFRTGLKEHFIVRDVNRTIVERKAGIMGVVQTGGDIRPGMTIVVEQPAVFERMECV